MAVQKEFLRESVKMAREAVALDAPIRPAAAAAHAANESRYGDSGLTRRANNLFGVKATGAHTPFWNGAKVEMETWEVVSGQHIAVMADFRAYPDRMTSFLDYGDIIRRVYPSAADAPSDAGFLAGLFLLGPRKWATDPNAFRKCASILGLHAHVLAPHADEGVLRTAHTVALYDLSWNDRVRIALGLREQGANGHDRFEVALRGDFAWRAAARKLHVRRDGT